MAKKRITYTFSRPNSAKDRAYHNINKGVVMNNKVTKSFSIEKNFKININPSKYVWSIGSMIAVVMSWNIYNDILHTMCCGFLGWIYILYYLISNN